MPNFINPSELLDHLELNPDMIAAEFGCGSGVFAIALAKKLRDGMVYGLDIQQGPLDALLGQSRFEKVSNVRVILCDLEKDRGSTLPDNALDVVLVPNLLFQVEDRYAIIKEAQRILRAGGQALIIDWSPGASIGPRENKISVEEVKEIAADAGFKIKDEFSAADYHWGLTVKKL